MATRWTEQGLAELNPVYSQERAALENQLPAISQLYQTLVAALEQSGAASQSDILADASRRGINRSTLAAQTSQALAPSLAAGLGQLEVDRTGRTADVYGQLSALEQGLAESGVGLGGQFQEQDISRQTQDMKLQELQRGYDLDARRKQLADAAEAARAARAASDSVSGGGGNGGAPAAKAANFVDTFVNQAAKGNQQAIQVLRQLQADPWLNQNLNKYYKLYGGIAKNLGWNGK